MTVRSVRVGDILQLRRTPIEIDPEGTYRPIGVRGFGRGLIDYPAVQASGLSKLRYFELAPSRLVISNIKAWEGAVSLTTSDEHGRVASNRFLTYAATADIDLRYVAHWLLSNAGLDALGTASPGSADRNRTLGQKAFEAIKVPLPPLAEQRRIADHLDQSQTLAESVDAQSKQVSKTSASAIEQLVGAFALGANYVKAGEVLALDRPWIEVDDDAAYSPIGVHGFGRGLIRYPTGPREALSKLRYFQINENRLIISNIKAWEGAVAVSSAADVGRIASNRFLQYRASSDDVLIEWIRLYLVSRAGVSLLQTASPGSADRNRTLAIKGFEGLPLPIPDMSIQHEAVSVAQRHASLTELTARREELANSLLPAARNEVFNSLR